MAEQLVKVSTTAPARRWVGALAISIPLGVLAWSVAHSPYVAIVGDLRTTPLPPEPKVPILLYRDQGTQFLYTASDLLRPDAFGVPGQFIDAVVYDVWPTGQAPATTPGQNLAWYMLIWKALAGEQLKPLDVSAADGFRTAMGNALRLDRGAATVYAIPSESSYRSQSGITQIGALGIRPPEGYRAHLCARWARRSGPSILASTSRHSWRERRDSHSVKSRQFR